MQGSLMLDIDGLWLTAADRHLLRQPEVAGVILFARNIDSPRQVRELCRSIKALRPDLLISVDQEGGRVQRLRRGFTALPAMQSIALQPNPLALAALTGWLMAWEVQAVGIDFSFAPVLDVDYGRSAVIGNRSFAEAPERVIELASAFIAGMNNAGMAAVGKHFPGHGWVVADSHVDVPVDERDFATLAATDLKVFAALADVLAGMMPAHVIYPAVDALPAGFSVHWLQKVLRQQLGYTGIIFSDDLSMAGAHVVGDVAARTLAAVTAGCDIVLVCNDRAAAEQSLHALQQHRVTPCRHLSPMYGRHRLDSDYQQHPDYQHARRLVSALH